MRKREARAEQKDMTGMEPRDRNRDRDSGKDKDRRVEAGIQADTQGQDKDKTGCWKSKVFGRYKTGTNHFSYPLLRTSNRWQCISSSFEECRFAVFICVWKRSIDSECTERESRGVLVIFCVYCV